MQRSPARSSRRGPLLLGAAAAGLISFNAPLSRAMLGAEVGEVLAFGGVEGAIEVVGIGVVGD